ncbi:MAG: EamA family transporter [Deltaproteobacteria bacterium]|nr:MAG: EamA family transporter [Deltaproteobacteria bacterium]
MKYAFQALDPWVVVFGRLLVASICLLPFLPSFFRLPIQRRHVLPLLAMALCEPCLYFIFEAAALERTTASQAAMITSMLPLLVALTAALFLGERLSRQTMIGFALAAAGAVWLSLAAQKTEMAPAPVLGNLLEFSAMTCATGYIILLKYLSRDLPPLFLTAVMCFVGALFFLPLLAMPGVELPTTIPGEGLAAVLYLGMCVTICAYGLYNFGVSRVPANQAAVYINLIPVFSIVLGALFLGDRFTPWQMAACLLVFTGVLLSQKKQPTKKGAAHG